MMGGARDLVVCGGILALVVGVSATTLGMPGHPARRAHAAPATSDGLPADLASLPPPAAGPADAARGPGSLAAQELAALSASRRPADAYAVYKLLATCDQAREQARERGDGSGFQGRVGGRAADDCAGVDESQVEHRVDWLRSAAAANVPGAVADLLSQGPEGQPREVVWSDPRYAGWRQQTLATVAQSADRGDRDSLAMLAHLYGDGTLADDGAQAIKYQVAWIDLTAASDPTYAQPVLRARYLAGALDSIVRLGPFLTPEQRAAAIEAGHALSAGCCNS